MSAPAVAAKPESGSYIEDAIRLGKAGLRATQHPLFLPITVALISLLFLFWPMTRSLIGRWSQDEYYSHGFLVPFLAGYIIYKRWPGFKDRPVRPSVWPIVPAVLFLPLLMVAYAGKSLAILSVLFVVYTLLAIWFIAGKRWATALAPAVFFLLFALPAWNSFIDAATNPLQLASSKVAFQILQGMGFHPLQFDNQPTLIFLNSYQFEVAVACSGMKLLLAVSCFTALFLLVGRLPAVGNLMMIILVLPLCLIMNGLRIAMIGMVGEYQGASAAAQFHDWSGYIMLGICFVILFKFARLFGWKD
ncbi:MAG: hypothetical protein C4320_04840 [Armatimonadota bacterium]